MIWLSLLSLGVGSSIFRLSSGYWRDSLTSLSSPLCGSWCEGEMRSGSPVAGLIRVYWHQWQGQLDNFLTQIRERQIATWQLPKIVATPDLVMHQISNLLPTFDRTISIGVSTNTYETYLMLQDAVEAFNYKTVWIEGMDANDYNRTHFSVMCVEGNSTNGRLSTNDQSTSKLLPHRSRSYWF